MGEIPLGDRACDQGTAGCFVLHRVVVSDCILMQTVDGFHPPCAESRSARPSFEWRGAHVLLSVVVGAVVAH